jgi:hypothetical protein
MTIRSTALVVAISAALACNTGGGGSAAVGSATINGNINGHAFQAADAIAANVMVPIQNTTTTASSGLVAIASNSGLCADVNANKEPKSTQYLLLAFTDVNPTTGQTSTPTAPGVYVVSSGTGLPPPKVAIAFYNQTDASCRDVPGAFETAVSGTITLSSVNNGSYSGSFDLAMGGGATGPADHITGSFNAPNCPGVAIIINQNRNTTCF